MTYEPPDVTDPIVAITLPTDSPTYTTNGSSLDISGTARDNVGVTLVSWTNDSGGSGNCSGTTSWSTTGITLSEGPNRITVTAEDAAGNTGTDTLTVIYESDLIDINIDTDFEYIPQGWPMGLTVFQTNAVGFSEEPYESLIYEPQYRSTQVQYGYLRLGNGGDNIISFAVDNYKLYQTWLLYVDINNNEDLTDDGPPLQNEGTGLFGANISFPNIDIVLSNGDRISRPYDLWFFINQGPRFYTQCHYRSQISIGGDTYTAVAYELDNHDVLYQESGLYIDLNRDGQLEDVENFIDGETITVNNRNYTLGLNYP